MGSTSAGDMTDEERAALAWLSRTDHRVRWSAWALLVGPVSVVLSPGGTSMALGGMAASAAIMGLLASLLALTFLTSLPVGGQGFRACRRMARGFLGLSADDVSASGLPRPLRALHVGAHRIMRRHMVGTSGPEGVARRVFRRGGPEAALDFLRLCEGFAPLGGRLRGVDPLVDGAIEEAASRTLALLRKEPGTRRIVLGHVQSALEEPTLCAVPYEGGLMASLLASGAAAPRAEVRQEAGRSR